MAKRREILVKRINDLKALEGRTFARLKKAVEAGEHEIVTEGLALHLAAIRGTKAGLRLKARDMRKTARKATRAAKKRAR